MPPSDARAASDSPRSPAYTVAVRSLCEFTARRGDLDFRFTPAPTGLQGMLGHAMVAARRGTGFQREITLEFLYKTLKIKGRADGYDPTLRRLEEFKTHRGSLALMPAEQRALHWSQLKLYGAMLCGERGLTKIELALIYFDIKTLEETVFTEHCVAADLHEFCAAQCDLFLEWARAESRHRARRDADLRALTFPHEALRAGQRQMAEAVYRAVRRGRSLLVQAPTGIGKTVGALFPLLKAMPPQHLDKALFLVAKTSGRAPVLAVLGRLDATLRVLELVSKENSCVHPGSTCDPVSCPLAKGFYDRLPAARAAALARPMLTQPQVADVAATFKVCPYFLTQELLRWCDVIVADYNYFFDTSAILHASSVHNQWRIGLLVDEAHNLLTRARDMYSATLEPSALEAALRAARGAVRAELGRLERAWTAVGNAQCAEYFASDIIAADFATALRHASAAIGDESVAHPLPVDGPLLRFQFDAVHFLRMADAFGSHSLFDVTRTDAGCRLCIRNVNPAPFLAPRFAACAAAVLFSATLSPADYYRRLLGLPQTTPWLDIESPFAAEQLEVRIERRISTRYRHRPDSLVPIADLMARQYRQQPGNYLAFFGSFDYLQAALAVFERRHADICAWQQTRGMDGAQRAEFLAHFEFGRSAGRVSRAGIGFAVLGGVFAEGIDLPGERLIGAFIATLGMPRICDVNAEVERRLQLLFQAGYEYTYLYPGLQKVVQAAGRVIRTPHDRGTVFLMDDRYSAARVRELLPRWWRIQCS